MGDHFTFLVNRLITESTLQAAIDSRNRLKQAVSVFDRAENVDFMPQKKTNSVADDSSLRKLEECRICQDEDLGSNMETPCSCSGSLKYAHRRCVQRWCNEKGDTMCEICHQQFRPGYTAPPPLVQYGHAPVNFRRNWVISRRLLNDPNFMAMVSAEQDSDSDSDAEEPSSRTLRYLSVSVIFVVLLILRHILPIILDGTVCCFPVPVIVGLRVMGIIFLACAILLAASGWRGQQWLDGPYNGPATVRDEQGAYQAGLQHHSHVIQVDDV